jgi:hypothetical protein
LKPAGESPSFVVGATDRWTRRMPLILLLSGLAVAACYYAVAVARGSGGHPAPPQSDTLIYMQYARAMAEGHPYIFNPGDAPSTGSTSHLYPAVLALAYLLGAHGDALLSAGFFINVCCYLVWLQLFLLVARRCVPGQATLAAGLVLLNGHLALVAMGQSDAGLFLALAWGLLAALLYGRFRWATALAVLCVLTRPEGMVLAAGLALLAVALAWRRVTCARQFLRVAGGGLLAVAAVPILNRLLTGMWQFQSVAGKGYLNSFPLVGALGCAANDLLTLLREVLFNLGAAPRQNYFPPVIGGCLAIIGLAGVFSDGCRGTPPSRKNTGLEGRTPASPAESGAILIWWFGCCLAAWGLIALSEFQGQGNDRYLAWMLPSWYLLAAAGAGQVARLIDRRQTMVALGVILLGFEAGTWPYFLARYATQDVQMQALVSFGRKAHAALPSGTPLGMLEGTGLRYYFGDRPVRHLNGITSSAFRGQRDLVCAIETLRHEPALRFGCWLVPASLRGWCEETGLLGTCVLTDTDGPPDGYAFGLFDARWDSMPEASLLPLDAAATKAVASMKLVDRLDVGYAPDERRCGYCFGSRLPDARFLPFVGCRRLGPAQITEVGQPVIGWDEFRIAAPQRLRPMRVVLRTALDATCTVVRTNNRYSGEGVHLRSPLRLRLLVNGVALPEMEIPVTCAGDAFAECLLEIPGEAVTTNPLDIVIAGDHLALGYWLYQ